MLESIVSSKTRVKLLLKFFLNSDMVAYLRGLESEFGESSNGIRVELNRMEEAGLLQSFLEGNKKMFKANQTHPLFREIHNILLKHIGLDQVIEKIINQLGDVQEVYLTGEFAKGLDSPIIDLVFVGEVDKNYLMRLVEKVEKVVSRKFRYMTFDLVEFDLYREDFNKKPNFLLWSNNLP